VIKEYRPCSLDVIHRARPVNNYENLCYLLALLTSRRSKTILNTFLETEAVLFKH